MRLNLYPIISAPFAEYPLTRRFNNRKTPRSIILLSIFWLLGLILFNAYTQGRLAQTETILSPHWYPKNDTWSCQPATIEVGNKYFTNEALGSHIKDGAGNKTDTDHRGHLGWKIEKGINTQTSFQYQEGTLSCNVTDILLYLDFCVTSVWCRICMRCSTPRVQDSATEDNYLSLCVSYDSLERGSPWFTEKAQSALRVHIHSFYLLVEKLHFPPHTLPGAAFPPDYSSQHSTISPTEIPNRDLLGWSAGMDTFNYTPAAKYSDSKLSYNHTTPEAQGKLYLFVNDTKPRDFGDGVINLHSRGLFTPEIVVLGVGNVHPFPSNLTIHEVSRLPDPLPKYWNLTQSIMALMMDAASKDVHNRVLGVGYLCTITKNPWKTFFPMLAMIIGNCSGMFGAGLTAMICLARRFENYAGAEKNYPEDLQDFDPADGEMGTIPREVKDRAVEQRSSTEEAQ